jgi:hypothetical protein
MTSPPMPGNEQFVIAGDPAVLAALVELLRAVPDASVVSAGDGNTPARRIVVALPPERAALLSQALGGAVQIESDQLLWPSS